MITGETINKEPNIKIISVILGSAVVGLALLSHNDTNADASSVQTEQITCAKTHFGPEKPSKEAKENMALFYEIVAKKYPEICQNKQEMQAVVTIFYKESRWLHTASSTESTAYGIPQRLLDPKKDNSEFVQDPKKQIEWGIKYIKERYKTPTKAWEFWQTHNWY